MFELRLVGFCVGFIGLLLYSRFVCLRFACGMWTVFARICRDYLVWLFALCLWYVGCVVCLRGLLLVLVCVCYWSVVDWV